MKKSFTILELIIVVALIALIATAVIVFLNPINQFQKAWDGKRKSELSEMRKIFEDYYNDKQCYPKPAELCYDASGVPIADGSYTCHICSHMTDSPNFSPYMATLPCDPQSPGKKYLYQTNDNTCPKWFRIFTRLSNTKDTAIDEVGCRFGCGVNSNPADYSYNYFVGSPNIGVNSCSTLEVIFQKSGLQCDGCKTPSTTDTCDYDRPLYFNDHCTVACGGQ